MIPALANHVCQSTVCAVAAELLTLMLRKYHARMRYAVWLSAATYSSVGLALRICRPDPLLGCAVAPSPIGTTRGGGTRSQRTDQDVVLFRVYRARYFRLVPAGVAAARGCRGTSDSGATRGDHSA
jgi:hypothetical protein